MANDYSFRAYRVAFADFLRDRRGSDNAERVRREYMDLHDRQAAEFEYAQDQSDEVIPREPAVRPPAFRNTSRLLVYVSCTDPDLYIFADGAKGKARQAYQQGQRNWSHEYTIDIVNVKITLRNRLVLITIVPIDEFEFEFACTANPIKEDIIVGGSGAFSFERYNGVMVGSHVSVEQNAMHVSSEIRGHKRTPNGADTSIIGRAYMVSMFNEPVAYRNPVKRFGRTRYPDTLMESFAPGHPHTGVHLRSVGLKPGAGDSEQRQPLAQHELRDIDFDVPFETNHNLDKIQDTYIQINADWPRACGVQMVKSALHGTREFAIYVDAFNQFHIFPTAAIEPPDPANPYAQNVNSTFVTRVVPVLPAWCYKQAVKVSDYWASTPDNGKADVDFPEPDWQFHPEGTRAASIFYERLPYVYDTAKFTTGDGLTAPNPFTQAEFDTFAAGLGVQGRHQVTFASGYNEARYFVAPGVIEVTVNIELTGDLLDSYTATLDVREVRRPTTTPYCSLYVGYVWYDVPFGAKVTKDTLGNITKDERVGKIGQFVSFDMERWTSGTVISNARTYRMLSIKDLDTGAELFTCPAGPILGIDIKSLSFAMQVWNAQLTTRIMPRKFNDPAPTNTVAADWRTFQFGVWCVVGTTPKEILWPNTLPIAERQFAADLGFMQWTPTKSRDLINSLLHDDPTWHLVPLNDSTDWSTGNWGAYRDAYLNSVTQNIGGTHPYPADTPAIERTLEVDYWSYYIGLHVFLCPSPKWGWYTYADELCNCVANGPDTTFYVHPSGTWTFWNNQFVYLPQGQPSNTAGDSVDYLPAFEEDVKTVEHVIFDRVHFEMRTNRRVLGHLDTSFLKLYNTAVTKGKELGVLEDGIETIGDPDLRARFSRDIYNYPDAPYTDVQFLKLKAVWDSGTYWFLEPAVQGGGYHTTSAPTPQQGGMVGLTFAVPWSDNTDYYAGNFIYPVHQNPHIRFCNPIVLQTVNA